MSRRRAYEIGVDCAVHSGVAKSRVRCFGRVVRVGNSGAGPPSAACPGAKQPWNTCLVIANTSSLNLGEGLLRLATHSFFWTTSSGQARKACSHVLARLVRTTQSSIEGFTGRWSIIKMAMRPRVSKRERKLLLR
jgi:hypothetical protein